MSLAEPDRKAVDAYVGAMSALFALPVDPAFRAGVGEHVARLLAVAADDPVCSERATSPVVPALGRGVDGLRIAVAEGYFAQGAEPEAIEAGAAVAKALGATDAVTFPESHRARAAAMVITAAEGAQQHLELLRTRAADFDPLTRDRFLAGALMPAALVLRAQRFRAWYRARVRELFGDVDVVLAPTTPCVAPVIGKTDAGVIGGIPVFVRAHLGVFTQPLSFIGLPVISVPVARPRQLPIGVQLVGAPWSEATLFRVAAALASTGVVAAPVAPLSLAA